MSSTSEVVYRTSDPALAAKYARVFEEHMRTQGPATEAPPRDAAEPAYGFFEFECKMELGGEKFTKRAPVGAVLRHTYKGTVLKATIAGPKTVEFNGIEYDNLTAAAFAAAKSVNPKATRPYGPYWWARETAPGVWTTLYRT